MTLTGHEVQIIQALWDGMYIKEVAARMHISPQTAKNELAMLKKKIQLPAGNQIALLRWALREGVIQP